MAFHQLAARALDDRADRGRLVERWQNRADRDPLLLLERDEAAEVRELTVVVVRLGEPAIDARRHAAAVLRRTVRGFERLGLLRALVKRVARDWVARLDHDH